MTFSHALATLCFFVKVFPSCLRYPIVLLSLHLMFYNASSQSRQTATEKKIKTPDPLLVGQQIPKDFWVKKHLFYINGDTIRKSLEEYKGELLILDFWSTTCAPCLTHQSDIHAVQVKYPTQFNIVMINSTSTKDDLKRIDLFYQRNKNTYFKNRDFTSIILDSQLQNLFPHIGNPHYAWINKLGYLQIQTFRNLLDLNTGTPFLTKGENNE